MGVGEQMRRLHEKEEALQMQREKALDARIQAVGLPPKNQADFKSEKPITFRGWDLYETLLNREGTLDALEEDVIQRGRESILIDEAVANRRGSESQKDDPFER